MGVCPQGEARVNITQIKAQLSTRRVQAGLIWKGKSGVNLGALPLVAMRTIHDAFDAPQHTGDSLDIHAVLQSDRCEGMSQIVQLKGLP